MGYAQRLGFAVFPVAADCRSPLVEHGVHDASADPLQIRSWWATRPEANVALACGPTSGVFCLDIDRHGETDGFLSLMVLQDEFGALPLTWCSATPSKGEHRFFRHPPTRPLRNRQKLFLERSDGSKEYFPGLDVRAAGGSAALPPSRKPHGQYVWLEHPTTTPLAEPPDWLLLLIDPPMPPPAPMPPIRGKSVDRVARYVEKAVDAECGELASMAPNTGRNLKLFMAAANLGSLVGAGLLPQTVAEGQLAAAAEACGLAREDGAHAVRATITSGMRKGLQNPREVRFER